MLSFILGTFHPLKASIKRKQVSSFIHFIKAHRISLEYCSIGAVL